MKYYDEQLQELLQQKARKVHLDVVLKDLKKQRTELEQKVLRLEVKMEKEQSDVERLEGRSLTNLFYYIIGKKAEKLDKEQQEAMEAAVKYETAKQELEAVEADISHFTSEQNPLAGCEERYVEMLKEKAEAVKAQGIPEAEEILQIEERIQELKNQQREIAQAISAAKRAQGTAGEIISSMNKAKNWGTMDMLGGGLIADAAKHSALDTAQNQVGQLQVELRRLRTELADVRIEADMKVNMEGFTRFADYFFDGLFADWTVMNRINSSLEQINATKSKIDQVLQRLNYLQNSAQREEQEREKELEEKILNAGRKEA